MEHSCSTYVETKSVNVETKSVNVETKLKNASRNRGNIRSLEKNIFEWLKISFRDFQSIRPMIFSFLVNNSGLFQQGLSARHLLNQLGGNLVSKPPPNHHAYSGQEEEQNKDVENKMNKDGEFQSDKSQSLESGKRSRKKIRKRKQKSLVFLVT